MIQKSFEVPFSNKKSNFFEIYFDFWLFYTENVGFCNSKYVLEAVKNFVMEIEWNLFAFSDSSPPVCEFSVEKSLKVHIFPENRWPPGVESKNF